MNLERASRNMEGVTLVPATALGTYDLMRHDRLMLSREAAVRLSRALSATKPDEALLRAGRSGSGARKAAREKSAARLRRRPPRRSKLRRRRPRSPRRPKKEKPKAKPKAKKD